MSSDLHGFTGPAWIGVDLDGTLAEYHGWVGPEHIGAPIPKMLARVLAWTEKGREVRIVTARVSPIKEDCEECRAHIQKWLHKHVYPLCPVWFREPIQIEFKVTHEKDQKMLELWDDRCVQVVPNTGERVDEVCGSSAAVKLTAHSRDRIKNLRDPATLDVLLDTFQKMGMPMGNDRWAEYCTALLNQRSEESRALDRVMLCITNANIEAKRGTADFWLSLRQRMQKEYQDEQRVKEASHA